MTFTHLHVRTAFSAHYGVARPEALVAAAAADGADALGCTDRDGLYGAVKHLGACRAAGIDPILGVDLRVGDPDGERFHRVVVLAAGAGAGAAPGEGYAALCRLISDAHRVEGAEQTCGAAAGERGDGAAGDGAAGASARGCSGGGARTGAARLRSRLGSGPSASFLPGITRQQLRRRAVPGALGDPGTGSSGGGISSTKHSAEPGAEDTATEARAGAPVRLVVLLGPDSDVGRLLAARRYRSARQALARWKQLLPPQALALEVVHHLAEPGASGSAGHAARTLRMGVESGVRCVLSNAVRYLDPQDAATADVLDAARTLTPLAQLAAGETDSESLQPNGQAWLKPAAQMEDLARDTARSADLGAAGVKALLGGTAEVADLTRLDAAADCGWGRPVVPEASVLGLSSPAPRELRQRCQAAVTRCYPQAAPGSPAWQRVQERLEHELAIIEHLGFASYFLTVAEVSDMIGQMGVRRAARGSGVSSLVNHLLGVSQPDPLEHGLIFERFLSRDRSTLPDIDIDVESARRHEVYDRIFERFGPERVSLMSMQNAYRARGAVRDAGMALGMEPGQVDAIAKQLWRFSASSFREALEEKPELAEFAQQVAQDRQLDLLVDVAERLDRLPRHISMHPCGVILSDQSLLERTPVQASGLGLPMSQFDKHDMDPMGMLKLDVLGVRMQSTLTYALDEIQRLELIRARRRDEEDEAAVVPPRIDLEAVPRDDPATFELIRSTHTLGCFQIESPGQRELIGKMAPESFDDLIVDISLFRPGPMQSNMVRPYLDQRHGFATVPSIDPRLDPILAETHGVTVFHEQILRILDTVTGCGLARADELRRKLGGPEEPAVERFVRESARAQGDWKPAVLDQVWEILSAFGSFGFCKAHGAAFAVPTYESAWLKAHHPEAFLAGVWEHDPGMYPKRLLVGEARRMGIPVLPVDVNRSDDHHRVEELAPEEGLDAQGRRRLGIRLSLRELSGVSEAEIARLVAGQPYASLGDLRARARPTRRSLERLASVGALDGLLESSGSAANRADLVQAMRHRADARPSAVRREVSGQLELPLGDPELRGLVPGLPSPSTEQTVRAELDHMALDVSAHLVDSYAPLLRRLGATAAGDLLELRSQTEVLVAGVRVSTMTPPMRGGNRVVFISLDDGSGTADCAFFDEAQRLSGPVLFGTRLLLVRGTTRRTGPRGISITALQAWALTRPDLEQQVAAARERSEKRGGSEPGRPRRRVG